MASTRLDFVSHPSKKGILIIAIALLLILLVDTFLIKFYDLLDKKSLVIGNKKILFVALSGACIIFQIIILIYVRQLIRKDIIKSRMKQGLFNKFYLSFILLEVFLFSLIINQIFQNNYYNSYLLIVILSASYSLSMLHIGQCTRLFFSWFRINRNFTLLIYSLSLLLITANLLVTNIIVAIGISDRPTTIRQFFGGTMDISLGKYSILAELLKITSILSFVGIWLVTALILKATKGSVKSLVFKWTLLVLPLIYFLASYYLGDIFYGYLFPFFQSDPVLTSIIFSAIVILSKPIGGITFGLLYWRISTLVKTNEILSQFMLIAGLGFMFLYSANQATLLVLTPFPPFGIITITMLVPASYLILVGIYKSASITSSSSQLRHFIYQTAKESKLLEILGKSEMEKILDKVVNEVSKHIEVNPDPSSSQSLESDELRNYVEWVIDQIKKDQDK